jgi:hypothetical protein
MVMVIKRMEYGMDIAMDDFCGIAVVMKIE